jgi:uncharacterized protein (TIGR02302 family)
MDSNKRPDPALAHIKTPLRLTLAGLWIESGVTALWPFGSAVLAGLAVLSFGLMGHLPLEMAWFAALAFTALLVWALRYAVVRFKRPGAADARARLDAGLAGRPLAALGDDMAIGADDPASVAVWRAHRARMAAQLFGLRAAPPKLRLAAADPFALRHGALLLAALALLFGAPAQLGNLGRTGGTAAAASGPMWEAWATPPAYTGKPTLYLADQPDGPLSLPIGTRFDLRLYGAAGDVILAETISARTDATALAQQQQSFDLAQSGSIRFDGAGGRSFDITALPDAPPQIAAAGPVARQGDARFTLPFTASDDYAVTRAQAEITLDLGAVTRSYGLGAAPDDISPVVLDIALPRRGGRSAVEGQLVDDLSKHVFSNLPVIITLSARDGGGNLGTSEPIRATLPGKRFFDPLAAAVIEMRRDILWARSNAPRSAQILKAVTHAPEGFVRNQRAYLRLRAAIAQLDAQKASLPVETRDLLADELWEIALLVEEGDLASARARLDRAQDRLDEAIRKGASPEEIADLMQEMRDALQDYMRQLSQEARERGDQTSENQGQDGPNMSQDQLQQMLDRLQQLMEQGKTAEAAELMQRLREFMENMQIAEGQGEGQGQGQGEGGPSGQAMRQLGDTLRGQQSLSDDAFRGMQDGMGEGQGEGQEQGEGEDGGSGDQGGNQGTDLAQRQQELRDSLDQLQRQGTLPGQNSAEGEAGRRALEDAARAMEDAEDALRSSDLPRALDGQAQALQALRDGLRAFNDALAQQQQNGAPQQFGQSQGQDDPRGTDPLGRQAGTALRNGSDENMLQGGDVYRRAEELLEEIRRRSGEGARPEEERNYLKRLLDLF